MKSNIENAPPARHRASGRLALILLAAMLLVTGARPARAQNCAALTPGAGGLDDAVTINNCLATVGYARLSASTSATPFRIFQPISFPRNVPGVQLTGAGNNDSGSVIQPQYTCGQISPFVNGNQYQPVIQALQAPSAVLSNFQLDLRQLRKSCGILGNYAIRVGSSRLDSAVRAQVTNLRIIGSRFSDPAYTTGWANGGGLLIINSSDVVVQGNIIRDLGFTTEIGGQSVSNSGIQVANCARARVQSNTITRVSFPLEVINGSPSQGYVGDASNTVISGNTLTGAAGINCPDCSAGRALKIQACGVGDERPLMGLSVTSNTLSNWGGPNQGAVVPSGLDLICGVQYSRFTGNSVIGDAQASYGLEIRSSFQSPQLATHHNVFDNNTFRAATCSGCFDVFFEDDGPDQGRSLAGTPSIGRAVKGTNLYSTTGFRVNRGCNQYAHAFFDYPPGQTFVKRGQSITVAAAGVRPSSSASVTYTFKAPGGNTVLTQSFPGGNNNCVMNQQQVYIDPTRFVAPGSYRVFATYSDGNSKAVIQNDFIGTGGQQTTLEVR
jgi:hypothetical protein